MVQEPAPPHGFDEGFAARFLSSATDFYRYGVHQLFNDWWATAPADAIATYVAAIEQHPEQGPLAAEGWLAEPMPLARLQACAPGTLGAAWHDFIVANGLVEQLAQGYRDYHEGLASAGVLDRLPPVLAHKVLRGYQTHDLHHVLTGFPATPFGELSLQAFQLAQTQFPYASMWIAVITAHMTFQDPLMIKPAMDAIATGWQLGRRTRSIQYVAFEAMIEEPLADIRARWGIEPVEAAAFATPRENTPRSLVASL